LAIDNRRRPEYTSRHIVSSLAELIARSMELADQSRQLVERSRSIVAASRRTLDRGDDDVAGHVQDAAPAGIAAGAGPVEGVRRDEDPARRSRFDGSPSRGRRRPRPKLARPRVPGVE
jgi:hypothetical protein